MAFVAVSVDADIYCFSRGPNRARWSQVFLEVEVDMGKPRHWWDAKAALSSQLSRIIFTWTDAVRVTDIFSRMKSLLLSNETILVGDLHCLNLFRRLVVVPGRSLLRSRCGTWVCLLQNRTGRWMHRIFWYGHFLLRGIAGKTAKFLFMGICGSIQFYVRWPSYENATFSVMQKTLVLHQKCKSCSLSLTLSTSFFFSFPFFSFSRFAHLLAR